MLRSLSVVIIGYLLGSIPFGYLIVWLTRGADVRETGSGGTGATNVSRRAGKAAGVVTLLLDALKGSVAVVVAKIVLGLPIVGETTQDLATIEISYWWLAAAAVAVIVGHIFPIWLRFRGGKGVATGVGVFLMLAPIAVVLAALIFGLTVWRTRYVSLGSMLAALSIPVFVLLLHFVSPSKLLISMMATACAGSLLIVFAHRQNIERLLDGTESKFQ